jgi:GH43 family beta-xylosidase
MTGWSCAAPGRSRASPRRRNASCGATCRPAPLSGFIWAAELHRVDGRWIMYFAAGPSGGGEDVFRIRTHAVACDGDDPMTGRWDVLGQVRIAWDSFNLDSTSFVHRGTRYFAWA